VYFIDLFSNIHNITEMTTTDNVMRILETQLDDLDICDRLSPQEVAASEKLTELLNNTLKSGAKITPKVFTDSVDASANYISNPELKTKFLALKSTSPDKNSILVAHLEEVKSKVSVPQELKAHFDKVVNDLKPSSSSPRSSEGEDDGDGDGEGEGKGSAIPKCNAGTFNSAFFAGADKDDDKIRGSAIYNYLNFWVNLKAAYADLEKDALNRAYGFVEEDDKKEAAALKQQIHHAISTNYDNWDDEKNMLAKIPGGQVTINGTEQKPVEAFAGVYGTISGALDNYLKCADVKEVLNSLYPGIGNDVKEYTSDESEDVTKARKKVLFKKVMQIAIAKYKQVQALLDTITKPYPESTGSTGSSGGGYGGYSSKRKNFSWLFH